VNEILENYLGRTRIGGQQAFKNLAVFPVTSDWVIPFDYLTLDEALSKGLIEVAEIDDHGSVPELKVVNRSDQMVLILDGEELVGAKQNRIVNTTVLIPAGETVVIPVSCVEQGRWAYTSRRFGTEKRLAPSTLRAMKSRQVLFSLRESDRFEADQGAIWNEISARAARRRAESDSMAMSEIYFRDRASLDDYLEHFAVTESQVGAVFAINGRVVGMDCFGKPETFAKSFKKLLESYALDAIDRATPEDEKTPSREEASDFIESAGRSRVEARPAVALGVDCRLESEKCTGFALSHLDQVFHLSVFARDREDENRKQRSGIHRFSTRRLFRRG